MIIEEYYLTKQMHIVQDSVKYSGGRFLECRQAGYKGKTFVRVQFDSPSSYIKYNGYLYQWTTQITEKTTPKWKRFKNKLKGNLKWYSLHMSQGVKQVWKSLSSTK